MNVVSHPEGGFAVALGGEIVAGPFGTNAEAWRWIDQQAGEPTTRRESVTDWMWRKSISDGAA